MVPESNIREVNLLDKLSKINLAEQNSLITFIANMDKISIKIFELAVYLIDEKNPFNYKKVYFSKQSLAALFNLNDINEHIRFRDKIEKMQKQFF